MVCLRVVNKSQKMNSQRTHLIFFFFWRAAGTCLCERFGVQLSEFPHNLSDAQPLLPPPVWMGEAARVRVCVCVRVCARALWMYSAAHGISEFKRADEGEFTTELVGRVKCVSTWRTNLVHFSFRCDILDERQVIKRVTLRHQGVGVWRLRAASLETISRFWMIFTD